MILREMIRRVAESAALVALNMLECCANGFLTIRSVFASNWANSSRPAPSGHCWVSRWKRGVSYRLKVRSPHSLPAGPLPRPPFHLLYFIHQIGLAGRPFLEPHHARQSIVRKALAPLRCARIRSAVL